ncbi:MAG: DUF4198 domain-containing protein [Sphingomonas sp.]|uniref:DUF4198 domain-containing protein n=1 Tax=Sphingomonas sp. TaxID=28214 RepID=UPI000DBC0990|nr:DUF4198 domain-containing protein [Sphingomonas sp.]PZU79612.1 MAG: DUF4198 domain-containing protein [Sphingomonas sp.]
MKKIIAWTLALASLGSTGTAVAHGIWFGQRGEQPVLAYGIGADDLEIVSSKGKVLSLKAYDDSFNPAPATLEATGPVLLVRSAIKPALMAAVMDNGTWSQLPNHEWVEKPKGTVAGSTLVTETAMKYAVAIQKPLTKPVPLLPEQILQIVPVTPIPDLLGKPVTYRVYYRGKPIAGVQVIADMIGDPDAKPVMSGANGEVTLNVRNQGINVLRAIYVVKPADASKTDRIEHLATLTFTLAHAPE